MASETDGSSRAEQALDVRLVVDTIPALAWSSAPDSSVDFVNQRWLKYTGLSPEASYGWGWQTAIHSEDLPELLAKWEAPRNSDNAGECEVRLRRFDGEFRWFLFRRESLSDGSHSVVRWYGTGIDIHDAKQIQTLRAAETRTLEMIANGASLSAVLNDLCSAIDDHASATSFVCLMDGCGNQLLPIAGPHVPPTFATAITPWPIGPNRGSCGTAAFTKNRVIIPDISNDSRWPDEARSLALNHGLCAAWSEPLISKDGEVLGTFCISYPHRRTPNQQDLELIEAAGHIARIAIERQRSQEALRRALDGFKQAEFYLAEGQRLAHTGSWAWSPEHDIRYWSEECYRVLGFNPQDGLPRKEDYYQRIHPDDQTGFMELIQTAIREKADWETDYRIVHPDGQVRDIHVIGHPVLSASGNLVEFVGTVLDVTERKRAEEELRRSEMELRQMLDFAPQLIAVYGPNRERLYANRVALDYLGLSLEEWRQTQAPGAFMHPDDRERELTYFARVRSNGSADQLELRLRRGDGSYRWFLARYNSVRDNNGELLRWYVSCTDIDDRKRAEEKLQQENVALREEIDMASMFEEIVGTSPALQTVLARISKVAPSDSTVLVTGETGTGKELVARAIHRRSHRASRAFVSVNCAAIPRDLVASELFGHEKGAFTGAMQRRVGRFELADGGTIFLDEVGDLLPDTQVALLRVLQEREFERVGGSRPIHVDVRIIAATNRDLNAAVASGTFREDLYYRLNVFPIDMPALRERREDIPLLVGYFIDRYARKAGKNIRTVEKKTLQLLQSYPWPGNIRELQNVIERSIIVCETENFSVDESWLSQQPRNRRPGGKLYLSQQLAGKEKEIIEEALSETNGQVFGPSGAAAKLGIARSTLESKIQSLNINKKRFKRPPGT